MSLDRITKRWKRWIKTPERASSSEKMHANSDPWVSSYPTLIARPKEILYMKELLCKFVFLKVFVSKPDMYTSIWRSRLFFFFSSLCALKELLVYQDRHWRTTWVVHCFIEENKKVKTPLSSTRCQIRCLKLFRIC